MPRYYHKIIVVNLHPPSLSVCLYKSTYQTLFVSSLSLYFACLVPVFLFVTLHNISLLSSYFAIYTNSLFQSVHSSCYGFYVHVEHLSFSSETWYRRWFVLLLYVSLLQAPEICYVIRMTLWKFDFAINSVPWFWSSPGRYFWQCFSVHLP
jgi:hypothetical protein